MRTQRAGKVVGVALVVLLARSVAAQVPFEQAVKDLAAADAGTRARAARMLKETAYPEAALPLIQAITDVDDAVQFEAIAGEVNIFLADSILARKRVTPIGAARNVDATESVFSKGPLSLGDRPVPPEVLAALRKAMLDDSQRVSTDALYAFGILAVEPSGAARRELLRASAPTLTTLAGASDAQRRRAAVRVIGRVFARRLQDEPVDPAIGDVLITTLNDDDRQVKDAAMQALGEIRYERAVQALTELFDYYQNNELAGAALDALARIAHPSSAALFTAQLDSKVVSFRGTAAEGLARIGDPQALPQIQAALGSARGDAVQLARAFASAMLGSGSVDAVADGLRRGRLHDQAQQYLVDLVPGRVSLFTRLAQDPDETMRAEIADVLALARDPASLPILDTLAKDPEQQVARAAARAIAWLRAAPRASSER